MSMRLLRGRQECAGLGLGRVRHPAARLHTCWLRVQAKSTGLRLVEPESQLLISVADILMADVLRLADRFDGLATFPPCRDYVARAAARLAFVKAYADQMAHFAAAD